MEVLQEQNSKKILNSDGYFSVVSLTLLPLCRPLSESCDGGAEDSVRLGSESEDILPDLEDAMAELSAASSITSPPKTEVKAKERSARTGKANDPPIRGVPVPYFEAVLWNKSHPELRLGGKRQCAGKERKN